MYIPPELELITSQHCALVALTFALRSDRIRARCAASWHRLAIVARRISLQTKVKTCISYYQIITQVSRVPFDLFVGGSDLSCCMCCRSSTVSTW